MWIQLSFVLLMIQSMDTSVGAAQTASTGPMMGWSSYSKFGCAQDCNARPNDCIGERLVKRTVDALVSSGLRDLGYRSIILDGCWSADNREGSTQKLLVPAQQFPAGMPNLTRTVQDRGLQMGLLFIENCNNPNTIVPDAQMAHDFNLDFIRHYACSYASMARMRSELDRQSKVIPVGCASAWLSAAFRTNPQQMDWNTIQRSCNVWRTTDWQGDNWDSILTVLKTYATQNQLLRAKSGPGHWVDLITLEVHSTRLSETEKRTNMGMWCLMGSPLFFSDDLDTMDHYTYELLANKRLIAIDQDPSAPPSYLGTRSGVQVWARKLSLTNTWAIAFVNENNNEASIEAKMSQLLSGIPNDTKSRFEMTDVFNGLSREPVDWQTSFKITIRGHDTEMFTVKY